MSTDPFSGPGNSDQRKPGDFKRRGDQGAPYVKSLTKTRQRQGNKPELLAQAEAADLFVPPKTTVPELRELLGPEPAWEIVKRPSGLSDLIEDQWNLFKWLERSTVLGIALDPNLLRILDDVGDDLDERQALDRICAQAHDEQHADTKMAADRGTYIHTITEWADAGMRGTPPWCDPRFNMTDKQIDAIAAGWLKLLDDNGLIVLASEATVVNDGIGAAGTLDRLVRTTSPIVFEGTTIPDDIVIELDIKTSKLHTNNDGAPAWWSGYPIQLLCYAGSVPYCCDDGPQLDTRGEWEQQPSALHAVIAHLDIDRLDDGEAVWQLIHVDLDVARQGVAALEAAEAYHAAPKFKMSATVTAVPCSTKSHRDQLMERYGLLSDEGKQMFSLLGITKTSTDDEVEAALNSVDPFAQVQPLAERRPDPTPATPARSIPDEGTLELFVDDVKALYEALDDKTAVNTIVGDAQRAGLSFSVKDNPTERRVALMRGICTLAMTDNLWPDILDALLVGLDVTPTAEPHGVQLGRLHAHQAVLFAQRANETALTVSSDAIPALFE